MSLNKKTVGALLLAGSSMLAANAANAGLVLVIDSLATAGLDVIVVDDADGGVGTATPWGASTVADTGFGAGKDGIVSFSIDTVEGSLSKIGTSEPGLTDAIDLFSYTLTGVGAFKSYLFDTDFDFGAGSTLVSEIGGTTRGTVTWDAYAGTDAEPTKYSVGGPFSYTYGSTAAFSGTHTSFLPTATTTLLGELLVEHDSPGDITTVDFLISVPEPTTLGLVGLGLAGIGLARRKKA